MGLEENNTTQGTRRGEADRIEFFDSVTAETVAGRPGLPSIVRSTRFGYDLAGPVTSLLTREPVQPGGGADKNLRTSRARSVRGLPAHAHVQHRA